MTEKTEALRLADELDAPVGTQSTYSAMREAAVELRRLHAQRDALLETLKELVGHTNERFTGGVWGRARAAIAAVEKGEKT